jgi:hypothetical protein
MHVNLLRKGNEGLSRALAQAPGLFSNMRALHAHASLPRHEQVAYHIRTTNEPRKKTHPLNVELITTQVSGEEADPEIPGLKQAKGKHAKLLQ